jgi:hypothetical protein
MSLFDTSTSVEARAHLSERAESAGGSSFRACAECGRGIPAEIVFTPPRAAVVCDSHVHASGLMGRRRSSALRMLAQKHGPIAVVAVRPAALLDEE